MALSGKRLWVVGLSLPSKKSRTNNTVRNHSMYKRIALLILILLPMFTQGQNQTYFQYRTDGATLVFFDKNLSRYIPHMMRNFQLGKALHQQIWTTDSVYQYEVHKPDMKKEKKILTQEKQTDTKD